jgi:hypothetical protein
MPADFWVATLIDEPIGAQVFLRLRRSSNNER